MKKILFSAALIGGIAMAPSLASAGTFAQASDKKAQPSVAVKTTAISSLKNDITLTLSADCSIAAADNATSTTVGVATKHKQSASYYAGNTAGGSLLKNPATSPGPDKDVTTAEATAAAS